jgi:ferredoxin
VPHHDIVHRIIYSSPGGSTKHVAEVIEAALLQARAPVDTLELWRGNQRTTPLTTPPEGQRLCLWIGSPVYALHPVPPVLELIDRLEVCSRECFAVPFATYGGVTSGTALEDMGRALMAKGYELLGAAKLLAVHSSLWQSDEPLGHGHPDHEEDELTRSLVQEVLQRLAHSAPEGIGSQALAYQPQKVLDRAAEINLETAMAAHPGFTVHSERCTQCGICEEHCPAGAIKLDDRPVFGEDCFLCHRCVRLCPEAAITTDTQSTEQRIRGLAEYFQESPPSAVFL